MSKTKLGLMAMYASVMASTADSMRRHNINDEYEFQKQKRIMPPSGIKEYFFDDMGNFQTEGTAPMRRDEVVFWTYAINDKNAIRKYNKWKSDKFNG